MAAFVVLAALVFWAGVFAIYFTSQELSPIEFLFGRYEPLPENLGEWSVTQSEEGTDVVREERLLLPSGRSGGPVLIRQTRERNQRTREILRVFPEERVRRRRGHPPGSG